MKYDLRYQRECKIDKPKCKYCCTIIWQPFILNKYIYYLFKRLLGLILSVSLRLIL